MYLLVSKWNWRYFGICLHNRLHLHTGWQWSEISVNDVASGHWSLATFLAVGKYVRLLSSFCFFLMILATDSSSTLPISQYDIPASFFEFCMACIHGSIALFFVELGVEIGMLLASIHPSSPSEIWSSSLSSPMTSQSTVMLRQPSSHSSGSILDAPSRLGAFGLPAALDLHSTIKLLVFEHQWQLRVSSSFPFPLRCCRFSFPFFLKI